MKFIPKNRRILLKSLDKDSVEVPQERPDGIILPDSPLSQAPKSAHGLYQVIDKADDVTVGCWEDDLVLVESNMVEEFICRSETQEEHFLTILENYIIGVVTLEEGNQ